MNGLQLIAQAELIGALTPCIVSSGEQYLISTWIWVIYARIRSSTRVTNADGSSTTSEEKDRQRLDEQSSQQIVDDRGNLEQVPGQARERSCKHLWTRSGITDFDNQKPRVSSNDNNLPWRFEAFGGVSLTGTNKMRIQPPWRF